MPLPTAPESQRGARQRHLHGGRPHADVWLRGARGQDHPPGRGRAEPGSLGGGVQHLAERGQCSWTRARLATPHPARPGHRYRDPATLLCPRAPPRITAASTRGAGQSSPLPGSRGQTGSSTYFERVSVRAWACAHTCPLLGVRPPTPCGAQQTRETMVQLLGIQLLGGQTPAHVAPQQNGDRSGRAPKTQQTGEQQRTLGLFTFIHLCSHSLTFTPPLPLLCSTHTRSYLRLRLSLLH